MDAASTGTPELQALLGELIAAHRHLLEAIGAGHEAEVVLAEERAAEIMRRIRAMQGR